MILNAENKTINREEKPLKEPWRIPWDEQGLETIGKCPVCGSQQRRIMFSGLVDNVFRVAPGYWDLHECLGCTNTYLDPRPSKDSIGQAYKTYYTHSAAEERLGIDKIGLLRLVRRALANGYINKRYGTIYHPSCLFGYLLAFIFRRQKEVLDAQFRWLPKPIEGQRVLDIGCGNGGFLLKARDAGWRVVGVDTDPNAVLTARKFGLSVYEGTVDMLPKDIGLFDAVTLNHVIEHVHDPRELLCEIYRILKPNGVLYIATPNIRSLGAKLFSKNWRGIETPRHLILFTINGLSDLVKECGFVDVQFKARYNIVKDIYRDSLGLRHNLDLSKLQSQVLPLKLKFISIFAFMSISNLDFITMIVRKNKS